LAPDSWKYEQLQAAQLVDLNPGTRAGLFWTVPVSNDAVRVDLAAGTATLHLEDVGVHDYTDLAAALASNATGFPSMASLTVTWAAVGSPAEIVDDQGWFYASHRPARATIVFRGWHVAASSRPGAPVDVPLAFRSGLTGPGDTTGQVTVAFGESLVDDVPRGVIGRERNGFYF
jgi:hypothetical protein